MPDNVLKITKVEKPTVTIHCCASPDDGERVNAQIIETANKLVLVDSMLMRPYAKEFRRYAESLGKPIDRLYVTHAHPDHWFGIEFFQDVPVYAFQETIDEIKAFAEIAIGFHRGQHGDHITDRVWLPNQAASAGEVVIDGVKLRVSKILNAEDVTMLVIDLPDEKVLIAQDLVYNKVHLFVGQRSMDGTHCYDGWIAALETFKKNGYDVVIPGHGLPTDASILDDNIRYLQGAKHILSVASAENFTQQTLDAFPDHELRSMVDMSAFFLFQMK
ncbi:MAG: MBL fold metallo-hydrolase [Thermoanaerobaculia bacterium]